jgi:hypothetical protein
MFMHIGMPVLISRNDATNQGVTNGAFDWIRHIGFSREDRNNMR